MENYVKTQAGINATTRLAKLTCSDAPADDVTSDEDGSPTTVTRTCPRSPNLRQVFALRV